jgi:hypothetical protein
MNIVNLPNGCPGMVRARCEIRVLDHALSALKAIGLRSFFLTPGRARTPMTKTSRLVRPATDHSTDWVVIAHRRR